MDYAQYFQSYSNYFWQWEDNLEVIAIPNGSTIAYREFVVDVFNKLRSQGIPPFGTLLLAIIATNPQENASIDFVCKILDSKFLKDSKTVEDVTVFMKLLSQVPEEYKRGRKRLLLFQAIFENCHNIISAENAHKIIGYYQGNNSAQNAVTKPITYSEAILNRDLRTLALLKEKFPTVADIIKQIANLPDMQEYPIAIEKIEDETITESSDIIDQLTAHDKTFHIGALVKRIWSGLNIPAHSSLPSQQPLGGVSDLTNKGDFDKLLISEFANDDIVFLSRLANNEALYIQREIPPASNQMERVILIDISLKNWGTPKTIAFATMLAIAKHPKTNITCKTFVIGDGFHAVSIENIDTIIEGIQLLDGNLHPGNGLAAFFKEYPQSKDKEIFIITEPSTLKQMGMLKAVTEFHNRINYWIYTDSDGNIDVYKKQQSSKKHIQHIQLPLQELWKKGARRTKFTKRDNNFQVKEYPILLRNSMNIKKLLITDDGEIFQIRGEKTLVRFYDKSLKQHEKGWEIISESLPFTHGEFEIGRLSNGEYVLLMFHTHTRELVLFNVSTAATIKTTFNQWKANGGHSFIFEGGRFYHQNSHECWSIDIDGTIKGSAFDDREIFGIRRETLKALAPRFSYAQSMFKNVSEIFINGDDKLVFNIHLLYVNKGGHLKLDRAQDLKKVVSAEKTGDNQFTFPDGSMIEINRNGMLILKSSNASIPVIYIPSALDAALAAATNVDFAGNPYYYMEPKYEVLLQNAGPQKIHIIKLITEHTELGLKAAKEIADKAPDTLIKSISKSMAEKIKKSLEEHSAVVTLRPVDNSKIYPKPIAVTDFYYTYLLPFVNQIIAHSIV